MLKEKFSNKKEKGQVGGVSILIGTVSALFIIGFLVMIYALIGGALLNNDVVYDTAGGSLLNETQTFTNTTGNTTSVSTLRGISLSAIIITNATTGGEVVNSANYTVSGGTITAIDGSTYQGQLVNVSASYSYLREATSWRVLNSTVEAISGVVTWFSIIIIITVMVVLILLTALIIRAIRGTGFVNESS